MAAPIFFATVGDTSPTRQITIQRDGAIVDLTGATAVNLLIRPEIGGSHTNSNTACSIVTPAQGLISYAPGAGDFPTAQRYQGEAVVNFPNNKVEHIYQVVTFVVREAYV